MFASLKAIGQGMSPERTLLRRFALSNTCR